MVAGADGVVPWEVSEGRGFKAETDAAAIPGNQWTKTDDATRAPCLDMDSAPRISGPVPTAEFATTHWSVVTAAGQAGTPRAQEALERLCQTYWPPLFAYLRRFGYTPEDAEDLTQDFFAGFLAGNRVERADRGRGRFRTFLLTSFKNHVRDVHQHDTALKRGGPKRVLSLDRATAELGCAAEPSTHLTPDRVFEKRWATTLLENVLGQVGADFVQAGKRELFEQLKGFVWGGDETSMRDLALRLGMSESAVKVTIHRLRRLFRERMRAEIAHTVSRPEEIDDELHHLAEVLRGP